MTRNDVSPEESSTREARRLYREMFGKLLDDIDETPSLICDRLFLGSNQDAQNIDAVKRHQIRYVLNMTGSKSYSHDFFVTAGYPEIVLLCVDAHDQDDYNISDDFLVALNFIHKSLRIGDGALLVHCAAGVSRSATIVAAYLMVKQRISASAAILLVHQARPCVCPNIGFLKQLLAFDWRNFEFN